MYSCGDSVRFEFYYNLKNKEVNAFTKMIKMMEEFVS